MNRPRQYPGTPLRLGDTGESVRRLQFYLRIIARPTPLSPAFTTDGIYGTGTRATVITFQTFYGLAADGVTGLFNMNVCARFTSTSSTVCLPPSQRPGTYPGTPLRQGDSGINVKEMQYYLYLLSAYFSTIPQIAYDGRFGPATTNCRARVSNACGAYGGRHCGARHMGCPICALFKRCAILTGLPTPLTPSYPGRPIGIGSGGRKCILYNILLLYIGFSTIRCCR